MPRPDPQSLIGKNTKDVPMSLQRLAALWDEKVESIWIGSEDVAELSAEEKRQYELAYTIMRHLAVRAPTAHKSGHPGGPLSSFTFAYWLSKLRDPTKDQPLRMSAGHLSVLAYSLQWLFGREGDDERLQSPQAIIDAFRVPSGLPGHAEAGIGDIPFGAGPLGKGVSNGLGAAFGLRYLKKEGIVDVLLADGDAQEGQVIEAFRLAAHLRLGNLVVHGDWNDIQLSALPSKTVAADFASIAAACGWQVIEVQNGNDPRQVKAALEAVSGERVAGSSRPTFICYYTTMGYGVSLMEEGSNTGKQNFHGTPLTSGEAENALRELPSLEETMQEYEAFRQQEKKRYAKQISTDLELEMKKHPPRVITEEKGAARKDFGAVHLQNLMKHDDRVVVLHADLAGSGGFDAVEKTFPHRVINVGVAEANMYMMAAGMRQVGLFPVTYTFAAFGTNEARANARLIDINCGHTRCGVLHDCTHAGLSVGEDGETHQEQNYLNLPFHHTQVWMPADSNQAGAMAERGLELVAEGHTSVYVFSPRTGHEQLKSPDGSLIYPAGYRFDGQADLVRGQGDLSDDLTILATGIMVHTAVAAADTLIAHRSPLTVRVLNVACIRPLDAAAVVQAAFETGHLLVLEDHNIDGGLSSQVADVIADFALPCSLRRLGLRQYFPSGSAEDLMVIAGIDTDSVIDVLQDEAHAEIPGGEDVFVTSMYQLLHNLHHSRFERQAQPFIDRLQTEKGYMDELRAYWAGRECPRAQLPSNEELLRKLG